MMINPLDLDTQWFFDRFNEIPPLNILEIGANNESISSILTTMGFNVTGIDLEVYDGEHNHKHIVDDFCKYDFKENFDIIICISSLEHFGIQYNMGNSEYDIIAVKKIWDLLVPNGVFYVSIPIAYVFNTTPFYRIYDKRQLEKRIIQDFTIVSKDFFLADREKWYDEVRQPRKYIIEEKAYLYFENLAGMVAGLKLKKVI